MSDVLLQLYHRFPASMRSIVASLRGHYLRSWRYGPETEQLIADAKERDSWSPERWKTWQENRLAYVLHRAATQVPYYHEQWAERRRRGDRAAWGYLENWPILDKEPLQRNPSAFVANNCNIRRMFHEHTSGTTGRSLDLWWSRDTVRTWYALFELRCRQWYKISRNDRWAMLGGQLVTPINQRQPPFWVWNTALNQLYMSSYHLAPDTVPYYLDALQRYRVTYILGYTSSLYILARELLQLGCRNLKMTVAITNAEPIFDYQRQVITEAFQCPVQETYGMAEIVASANECLAGGLHLWPEVGWVEILENNQPVSDGTSGRLVCTGLLNRDMPLIRYDLGDRGTPPASYKSCTCGRRLPMLASVDGRTDDVLYTSDGRCIGRLDPVFKARLPVREAQIIQETLNRVRVRYVPAPDFKHGVEDSIIERLRARMGAIEVVLEQIDKIPRTANGKFRAVICNLPQEQRKSLLRTPNAP